MAQDAETGKMPDEPKTIDILDLCTGSGCVLISLVKTCEEAGLRLVAAEQDINKNALPEACCGSAKKQLSRPAERKEAIEMKNAPVGACCGPADKQLIRPVEGKEATENAIPENREAASEILAGRINVRATGTDISAKALDVARENARRMGMNVRLLQGNLFEPVKGETFDLIVSNPPYIPSRDIDGLSNEVKDHDPRLALDGGEDGLDFYRMFAEQAEQYLKKDGAILVEHGFDQGEAVRSLFKRAGFTDVKTVKDLSGNERVTSARRVGSLLRES